MHKDVRNVKYELHIFEKIYLYWDLSFSCISSVPNIIRGEKGFELRNKKFTMVKNIPICKCFLRCKCNPSKYADSRA